MLRSNWDTVIQYLSRASASSSRNYIRTNPALIVASKIDINIMQGLKVPINRSASTRASRNRRGLQCKATIASPVRSNRLILVFEFN